MVGWPGIATPERAQGARGRPEQGRMFTVRIKMPAGYVIPPHTHPKIERVTVLSGELGLAWGPTSTRASSEDARGQLLRPRTDAALRAGRRGGRRPAQRDRPVGESPTSARPTIRNQPQARKGPAEAGASRKPTHRRTRRGGPPPEPTSRPAPASSSRRASDDRATPSHCRGAPNESARRPLAHA